MIDDFLARLFSSELTVFLVVVFLMLAFAEIGFRLGLRLPLTKDEARKGQIGAIQGVVIVLIFDISHPRVGLIQIGQKPLEDLQQSIQTNRPIDR